MSWRDRDYARAPTRGGGFSSVSSVGSGLGRSIVTTLIIVNVVVFVLGEVSATTHQWLQGYQTQNAFGQRTHHLGVGELQANAVLHGQVWRLFTAQYLHAGMFHLLINMLVLHFLGRSLERMWSPKRFFTIYTLCGLAGNLFYVILGWQGVIPAAMPAVGASGCIYGLLGIVAVLFPNATVYIYMLFPVKIRTAAFIFAGIAFYTIIRRGSNFGGEACHLAGLVFGVWWAMKGDAWWSSRSVRVSHRPAKSKVGRLAGFEAEVRQRRDDAKTIDEILRKVYDGGIHSLSEREKRALGEATERQQERDREAGRTDRM